MPDSPQIAGKDHLSPAGLLDPHREIVSFAGRSGELERLSVWCAGGRADPVRVVTGAAGTGKTRLAVELARRMTASYWRAEWLGTGDEAGQAQSLLASGRGRLLLIIDEADLRDGLPELLSVLAEDWSGRWRALLLARELGLWWRPFFSEERQLPVSRLTRNIRRTRLALEPALAGDLTDAAVLRQAAAAFAAAPGGPVPAVRPAGTADGGAATVLDLHAAALVAVMRKAGSADGDAGPGRAIADLRDYLVVVAATA